MLYVIRHCSVLAGYFFFFYKGLAFHETGFIMFVILVPVNSISDHVILYHDTGNDILICLL